MTTLRQALKLLDPQNDDHWTAAGLPKMEAVEAMTGQAHTREEVEQVAPDLRRSNAEPKAADPDTVAAAGDGAPEDTNAMPADGGAQPPIDNDHVAEGATQFSDEEVAANLGHEVGEGVKAGGLEGRVAQLEADLAFLRGLFGWPTRNS